MEKRFSLTCDLKQCTAHKPITLVGGDTGNVLDICVFDDGIPADLGACAVRMAFARPDGVVVEQDEQSGLTITDAAAGRIECALRSESCCVPGVTYAELIFLDELRVTTTFISFTVRAPLESESAVRSSNQFPLLDRLIAQTTQSAQQAEQAASQALDAVAGASDAAMRISQATTDALALAAQAESTVASLLGALDQENLRISGEAAREEAENLRKLAEAHRDTAFQTYSERWNDIAANGAALEAQMLHWQANPPQGSKGDTGDTGAQGPQGPKGDKGDAGAQGPKGDKGDAGAQGPKGDTGDAGTQGPAGDTGRGLSLLGSFTELSALLAAHPSPMPGDAYLVAGDIMLFDSMQGWINIGALQGAKGDAGAQGPKGDTGDAGAQGPKGDKGDAGAQGPKGDKGDAGVQGPKGDKGDAGAQGPKGDKGDAGVQGPKGDNGQPADTWAHILDKPTHFPPSAHTHVLDDITALEALFSAKLSLSGGALCGPLTAAPSGNTAQVRNIIISADAPTGAGNEGDIWIQLAP